MNGNETTEIKNREKEKINRKNILITRAKMCIYENKKINGNGNFFFILTGVNGNVRTDEISCQDFRNSSSRFIEDHRR